MQSYKVYNKFTYPTEETCHENLLKALEHAFKFLALVMSEDDDIADVVIERVGSGYEIVIGDEKYLSVYPCY